MTVETTRAEGTKGSVEEVRRPDYTLRGRVLLVDDDSEFCAAVAQILRTAGYEVESVAHVTAAVARLSAFVPDAVVSDVAMPGLDGFALLDIVHAFDPSLGVVLVSGAGDVPEAVRAVKAGAAQYLLKPVEPGALVGSVARLVDAKRARARIGLERGRLRGPDVPRALVAESAAMRELLPLVASAASSRSSVLVHGETGSGKDCVAEAIHFASSRAAAPVLRVHCTAFSEPALVAEIFGCERGALADAASRREGRLRQADGGTLILHEVDAMPSKVQAALLRFLRERLYERLGGSTPLRGDTRVIATTTRDLASLVARGDFLPELYYRLNVVALDIPPLRARIADLPLLAEQAIARLAAEFGIHPPPRITVDGMDVLVHHPWPGNVRELEALLEGAIVSEHGGPLSAAVLAPILRRAPRTRGGEPRVPGSTFAEVERHAILATYEAAGRSVQRAAALLGISPRTIHYRLREYRGLAGRRQSSVPANADTT